MSNKLSAVDIVLLLDSASEKKAIEVSKEANKEKTSELVLGSNALPHISLLMGGLDEEGIETLKAKLEKTVFEEKILNLKVEGLENPGSTWGWEVVVSKELFSIYKKVIEECWKSMVYPVSKESFYGEYVNDKTPIWVNAFERQERIDRFNPHVTLSTNEVSGTKPFNIKAVSLALFQLGNYCTCARELVTLRLKEL